MRVSIINGSPRSRGATATVLKIIGSYLSETHGVDVRYVDLARVRMRFCRGCIACYRTGTCSVNDGLEAIVASVKQSDGIVIGSPTHGSNVSALLKNFLDRGHFLLEQSLGGKYGFSVVTEEIADGGAVLRALQKFYLVAGARRSGRFLLKLDFDTDPFAHVADLHRLHRKLERFYAAIAKRKKRRWFERVVSWLLVRVVWMPVFLRNPSKYAGILEQWERKGVLTQRPS